MGKYKYKHLWQLFMAISKYLRSLFGLDKETILFLLILLLFIGSNFYFLTSHFVYNEKKHAEVALDVFSEDKTHINYFYESSASPHTIFIPIAFLHKFIQQFMKNDFEMAARTYVFLISIIFLIITFIFVKKLLNPTIALLSMLLLSVHPMFIVYSKYIIADVPFVFLASVSLLLFYLAREVKKDCLVWKYDVPSALLLGLAFLTKYNAVIVYPIIGVYLIIILNLSWKDVTTFNKKNIVPLLKIGGFYGVISLIIALPMIIWIKTTYQHLIPVKWHDSLFYEAWKYFIPQLSSYIMWVGLFAGVLSVLFIMDLYHRLKASQIITSYKQMFMHGFLFLTAHSILFYFVRDSLNPLGFRGEMNLGWIEQFIQGNFLLLLFYFVLLIGELIVFYFFLLSCEKNRLSRFLGVWFLVSILIMSLTRPANRYLMIIFIPLIIQSSLLVVNYYKEKQLSFLLWKTNILLNPKIITLVIFVLHILVFVCIDLLSNLYLLKLGFIQTPKFVSVSITPGQ